MKIPYIRKLQKISSYSYGVSLPKEIVDAFGWKKKQRLSVVFDSEKQELVIRDLKKSSKK